MFVLLLQDLSLNAYQVSAAALIFFFLVKPAVEHFCRDDGQLSICIFRLMKKPCQKYRSGS